MNNNTKFLNVRTEDVQLNLQELGQLVFEVTNCCNLRCYYCVYSNLYEGFDIRQNENLSIDKAKQMINYLFDIWSQEENYGTNIRTTWIGFYGGEPLLNINFIKEIIKYIESQKNINRYFKFNMTTNAILLDKYMDYLVEKKIDLLISLDGNEFNNSYRVDSKGRNCFHKIMDNLKLIQKKYPDYFNKHINFNSVLHNRNNIKDIFDHIYLNFGKIPKIEPLSDVRVKETMKDSFNKIYSSKRESFEKTESDVELKKIFYYDHKNFGKFLEFYNDNIFSNYLDLFTDKSKLYRYPTGTCLPFGKKIFLSVNGKILPCERVNHMFSLGQVYDDRIELDISKITENYNYLISIVENKCKNCSNKATCRECIYRKTSINTLDPDKIQCSSFQNSYQHKKYVKDNMDYLRKNPHLYREILTNNDL